jgi:hypothetical protein
MDKLDGNTFKGMFQVDHRPFDKLLDTISPYLDERNSRYVINSSGSGISNKNWLTITL